MTHIYSNVLLMCTVPVNENKYDTTVLFHTKLPKAVLLETNESFKKVLYV